jgi:hypothetical protein
VSEEPVERRSAVVSSVEHCAFLAEWRGVAYSPAWSALQGGGVWGGTVGFLLASVNVVVKESRFDVGYDVGEVGHV